MKDNGLAPFTIEEYRHCNEEQKQIYRKWRAQQRHQDKLEQKRTVGRIMYFFNKEERGEYKQSRRLIFIKDCLCCGKEILTTNNHKKYCTEQCRYIRFYKPKEYRRIQNEKNNMDMHSR